MGEGCSSDEVQMEALPLGQLTACQVHDSQGRPVFLYTPLPHVASLQSEDPGG